MDLESEINFKRFSIAIYRAEQVCVPVIIKHNYILMCKYKIVATAIILDPPAYDDLTNCEIALLLSLIDPSERINCFLI